MNYSGEILGLLELTPLSQNFGNLPRSMAGRKSRLGTLFCSFAAGSNRRGSDLDLAFLSASQMTSAEYGTFQDSVVVDLGQLTRLDVHPIIMNGAGKLVLEQILRKRSCVYQGNEEALSDFRRKKLPLTEFAYYRDLMWSRQKQRYGAGADG